MTFELGARAEENFVVNDNGNSVYTCVRTQCDISLEHLMFLKRTKHSQAHTLFL